MHIADFSQSFFFFFFFLDTVLYVQTTYQNHNNL